MAKTGFTVFAGVRKPPDGVCIASTHANIHSIILDVTDESSIKAAVAKVQQFTAEQGLPFVAVVANAGICKEAPLEFLSMSDIRSTLEVNFFGAVALAQAFIPLARLHQGRMIFVSSFAGKVVWPEVGAYSASKAALNAVADALRIEVLHFGVSVSTIIPGAVSTAITAKRSEYRDSLHAAHLEIRKLYPAKPLAAVLKQSDRWAVSTMESDSAIVHSICSDFPKIEYFLGRVGSPLGAGITCSILSLLPLRLSDFIKAKTYN